MRLFEHLLHYFEQSSLQMRTGTKASPQKCGPNLNISIAAFEIVAKRVMGVRIDACYVVSPHKLDR